MHHSILKGRMVMVSLLLCLLSVFVVVQAWSQATQQFTGHVLDSTGAVVPAASVVIRNQATGVDYKTLTTSQGIYTIPYLIPGTYTITVTKQGFKSEAKTNILLNVAQTSTIDFELSVGVSTEQITVNSSSTQVELTKADRGEIIDSERISELPLDSRNPFGLFALSPGTHDFSNQIYPRPFDNVTNNQYANGSPQQGSINLDGLTNDTGGDSTAGFSTNTGLVPSVDVVNEYKVVLNAYDASYGRSGGSSIDLALKSGGNRYHGVVDYYMRRSWLDAYPWATKYSAGLQGKAPIKPAHKRDQYSFELEGPLVIPHLYDGRNKLFFVVSYEQMNELVPSTGYNVYSLPNPAWLNGDFSTATYWNNQTQSLQPLNIYDPLSPLQPVVDPIDGKTKLGHAQFPGNKIPANRIDPVGQTILGYLTRVYKDQPSQIVSPGAGYAPYTNNYQNLQVERDTWRNALVKVDYRLTDNDSLSFRWGGQGRWSHTNSNTGLSDSNPGNMNGHGAQPVSQTGSVQWTHTFNPNLLLNLGGTVMSQKNLNRQGPRFEDNFPNSLGFSSGFTSQLQNIHYFPYTTASGLPNAAGYVNLGYIAPANAWFQHALAFLPTITWVRGAHTIRAGFDTRFTQWANPYGGSNDSYAFTNNFTNRYGPGYSDAPSYTSGSSIAGMLLGYLNSGSVNNNLYSFYSQHYFAPWFQDDWKLTKKLTLNIGLRWDFLTPKVERYNRLDGVFNTGAVNPVSLQIPTGSAALGTSTTLMGGLEFAAVNGQPRAAYRLNKLNVQPRVGFAYAITPKMSIRGGIGQNYLNDSYSNPTSGFSSSTGYNNSLDGGITPYTATTGAGLSNPYPAVIKPTGFSRGYLQNLGQGISFWNPNYHIPSLWSYSMSYEVAVTSKDVIDVSYVGNRVPNGRVDDNINHISAGWDAMCDVERAGYPAGGISPRLYCDSTTYNQIANPFRGVAAFSGTSYYSNATLTKSNFGRPYPQFGEITQYGAYSNGKNWYNSLQVMASHQVAKSLSLHFAYTHAKAMAAGSFLTANNSTADRIVSRQVSTTNDVKHAISFSGVTYLPFGRGRAFFSNVNRWVDQVINGWEVSPLYTYYSGFPWRPSGNWEMASTGGTINQPLGVNHGILAPDGSHSFSRIRGATPCVGYKDTDTGQIKMGAAAVQAGCSSVAFVTAPNGYALPRANVDFGIRQPGAYKFDLAASKNFKIPAASKVYLSEATNLQLRVDLLNVLNHANWDQGYNGDSTSLDFGTIAKGSGGPTNPPRYMQLSARLTW